MRPVEVARLNMDPELQKFICIQNVDTTPIVSFTIQSAPVSDVGVNGMQVQDMISYCWQLVFALNDSFPCQENELTMSYLSQALDAQDLRTRNRVARNVEGKNLV